MPDEGMDISFVMVFIVLFSPFSLDMCRICICELIQFSLWHIAKDCDILSTVLIFLEINIGA